MTTAADIYALQETDLALDRALQRLSDIEAGLGESEELIEARQEMEAKRAGVTELRARQKDLEWSVDEVRRGSARRDPPSLRINIDSGDPHTQNRRSTAGQKGAGMKPQDEELSDTRRSERAIWKSGGAGGGTLTLTADQLIWRRSRWAVFTWSLWHDAPPRILEIDLATATVGIGPRRPDWFTIILMPAVGWLWELLTGGLRRTLKIRSADRDYYISVKDAESWLADLEEGRASKWPIPTEV